MLTSFWFDLTSLLCDLSWEVFFYISAQRERKDRDKPREQLPLNLGAFFLPDRVCNIVFNPSMKHRLQWLSCWISRIFGLQAYAVTLGHSFYRYIECHQWQIIPFLPFLRKCFVFNPWLTTLIRIPNSTLNESWESDFLILFFFLQFILLKIDSFFVQYILNIVSLPSTLPSFSSRLLPSRSYPILSFIRKHHPSKR